MFMRGHRDSPAAHMHACPGNCSARYICYLAENVIDSLSYGEEMGIFLYAQKLTTINLGNV